MAQVNVLAEYLKQKQYRKLIQSLVPLFKHQDVSLRLIAHSYLVHFAKLCHRKPCVIPYCYRLFLIYQTMISVQCDSSADIRRICIKALFVWTVTCNSEIIGQDLRKNALSLHQIAPLILSIVGITDTEPKNRIVVFHQLSELLADWHQDHGAKYISLRDWTQMFYKKPLKILNVESVSDVIPSFYQPILHHAPFLFLHTSFALCYDDLLTKIDHIFSETLSTPYLYIHLASLTRTACGLFSHVLDDEFRDCRIAALHTLKHFVKYHMHRYRERTQTQNEQQLMEIHVNVSSDITEENEDEKITESRHDDNDHIQHTEVISRALSFMADLLNDESQEARSLTLNMLQEIMVFGREYLRIGDDFLPLILMMTGDYVQETRLAAYKTLQFMHLAQPHSLLSCIKSMSSSIVRYYNDKSALLYALAVLSYRHSRLLEPILDELMCHHQTVLSVTNLKHLCLAVIMHYACTSNLYLKESISSSVFRFIDECKLKYPNVFEHDVHNVGDSIVTQMDQLKLSDTQTQENTQWLALSKYLKQCFQASTCDLKLINTMIPLLHTLGHHNANDIKSKVHKSLSLWSILSDLLQLIELSMCGRFVASKLLRLEHDCTILYQVCTYHSQKHGDARFSEFTKLLFAACCTMYHIAFDHNGNDARMQIADFMLKIENNFNLSNAMKSELSKQFSGLQNKSVSLWQCIQSVWRQQSNDFNYMQCFQQYNELICTLRVSNQYKQVRLTNIVELNVAKKRRLHFHSLAPMEIPVTCTIIADYVRFIKPKIKVTLKDRSGNVSLRYHLVSEKQWMKDIDSSNEYLTFSLRLPNLFASSNMNPIKNFQAEAVIEMFSNHAHCALSCVLTDAAMIHISNSLTIPISVGFV